MQVRVGVSVFVMNRGNKYLLGKRKNSHGEGCWANPGGHLEFGESLEECARREVLEESGLLLKDIRFLAITNDIFEKEQKHYVTIHLIGAAQEGEPVTKEFEKIGQWQWFDAAAFPKPLFLTIENLLRDHPDVLL